MTFTTPRASTLLAPLAALLMAAACGSDPAGGGTDGGPDGGTPPPPPHPTTATLEAGWQREGFAELWALDTLDLEDDGSDEIVLGGRGVALLGEAGRTRHHPVWSLDWRHGDSIYSGGDRNWAYDVAAYDADGDGVKDVLALDKEGEAYLVDGVTGKLRWLRPLLHEGLTTHFAVFDGDDDGVPDFFPAGTQTAYSGATGLPLWTAALGKSAIHAQAAELDGEPGRDLLLVIEVDQIIGGWATAAAPEVGDPAVFAYKGDGTLLWSQAPDALSYAAAPADLDGDGVQEAVSLSERELTAWSATGELWSFPFTLSAREVVAADADGDGRDDAFVLQHDPINHVSEVVAVSADGVELWRYDFDHPFETQALFDLDGDGDEELVVSAGDVNDALGEVFALDLEPSATERELWRLDTRLPVRALARATVDGEDVLLLGGSDGWLRAVAPATGAGAWEWATGYFLGPVASGDLDGDGLDEIAAGDDLGTVSLSGPESGDERWARRLDDHLVGRVKDLALADLTGDGHSEVIAAGAVFGTADLGRLKAYDAAGEAVLSLSLAAQAEAVRAADLDGDGSVEIVVAELRPMGIAGGPCGVRVLDATGATRWSLEIEQCIIPNIDLGDLDGDGDLEIAYADVTMGAETRVVVLEHDGAVAWDELSNDKHYQVHVGPQGVVTCGHAADYRGHVTLRSGADGSTIWRTYVEPLPEPDRPERMRSAGVRHAALVPDQDGDGIPEVAASSLLGTVQLLDGATGETLWSTPLEALDLPEDQRHDAGPLAWIEASERTLPFLAVGQTASKWARANVLALTPEGEISGSIPLEGESHDLVPAHLSEGRPGLAVTAGLAVRTFQGVPAEAGE